MITRSQTRSKALGWISFPAEIRLIILATIAYQKYPGWASLASKVNFQELKLRMSCLDDFEHIAASQKRRTIRHISPNVELPRYTSTCCSKQHSPSVKISSIRTRSQYHDPQHSWIHGQQVKGPPKTAMLQLFRPIRLAFHRTLPRVKAVTCLIIRRQLRRCISPSGLGLLLSSFDRLEHVSYEPWAPYDVANREFYERVFEDSYKFYDLFPTRRAHVPWLNLFDPSDGPGAVFASKSLNLQHLATSFIVNAEELFRHCQSTWSWLHLQSLVLVQKMPKLHTFVLWNGGKARACAFTYRIDRDGASVTWRGTWHLELSPLVVKSWQLAASKLPWVIKPHGDAIYRLDLPCQVIDPTSLWQTRREGYSFSATKKSDGPGSLY
ncbi:hypothetical protein F5B21DRAFT_514677 [Xylaria acuta]|nr:hypothetical protein F5B21DRAFT_514677 [Xylaria acuta]